MEKPYKDLEIGVDYTLCSWENLGMDDEGLPKDIRGYRHLTAQLAGDTSGALVEMQGRILPGQFDSLFDLSDLKSSSHDVLEVKPKVIGGDEKTKITVAIICRR